MDLQKPIRTGRGANKGRPSRQQEREDTRVMGYPSGHILSKQNTCLVDKRGSQHVSQVEAAALRFDCAETATVTETVETHLIPRRSTTFREHLKMFPIRGEVVDMRGRQAEKMLVDLNGRQVVGRDRIDTDREVLTGRMIRVTERKQITKPVNNLLLTGNPFRSIEDENLSRRTSRSKQKISDKSTYKNYMGEGNKMPRPDSLPSLTLDADDPIFKD